jgi:hypothetical protein
VVIKEFFISSIWLSSLAILLNILIMLQKYRAKFGVIPRFLRLAIGPEVKKLVPRYNRQEGNRI